MSKKQTPGKATKRAGKATMRPLVVNKGINDIDFSALHLSLDHYEGLLNGVVGRVGSQRAADIRDKIRSLQRDINCQSTMVIGF